MAFPDYVSCMKIGSYPLFPPLMTESRREECRRHREEAIAVEQRLDSRRSLTEAQDVSCSEKTPSPQGSPDPNQSPPNVDNREILLDFVKTVLQDVLHTEEGQNLQDQIMEELGRLDLNSDDRSRDNTLNNVDNFSLDETPRENMDNVENDIPESPREEEIAPPKLVRRNSYTLESPSQCVITYLKSLTKQEGVESWEPDHSRTKSVSKNLNDVWGECSTTELDYCADRLGVMEISDVSPPQQNNTQYETFRNNNYTNHISPRTPLANVNHAMNNDDNLILIHHRAATVIQAFVRGFLVRRLMKTNKVIELKTTIKECLIYALSLHAEQTVSPADINLHVGLIRQVTAACYELHSIFFEWPIKEKMNLIHQDRIKLHTPKSPLMKQHKSPRKFLKRRMSTTSTQSSTSTNASRKNSFRSSPYSLSKSSSASALKYQPWM